VRAPQLALLATTLAGCGGATAAAPRAAAEPDRCLVALRFAGEESAGGDESAGGEESAGEESATAEPEAPRTLVSLVRICDRDGRVVAPLGEVEGVCQHAEPPAGAWISARCWWPGRTARGLRVVGEGPRVTALGADEDVGGAAHGALEPLASVELPRGARVEVLAPDRRPVRSGTRAEGAQAPGGER
jgi:hypothetical protein